MKKQVSKKSYAIAVILSMIFGILGVHHFYLRRWKMAAFDLGLTIIGFSLLFTVPESRPLGDVYIISGMLVLAIDFIHTIYVTYKLFVGEYADGDGNIVTYPGQKIK